MRFIPEPGIRITDEQIQQAEEINELALGVANHIIKRYSYTRLAAWLGKLDDDNKVTVLLLNYPFVDDDINSDITSKKANTTPAEIIATPEAAEALSKTWKTNLDRRTWLASVALGSMFTILGVTAFALHIDKEVNAGANQQKILKTSESVFCSWGVALIFLFKHVLVNDALQASSVIYQAIKNDLSDERGMARKCVNQLEPVLSKLPNKRIKLEIHDYKHSLRQSEAGDIVVVIEDYALEQKKPPREMGI